MKANVILTMLLCVFFVCIGQAQYTGSATTQNLNFQQTQATAGTLYDDFNEKWLDPMKWAAMSGASSAYTEACYWSTNILECIREIRDGKLRLAVKSYGGTDSNDGSQYGESKIAFVQSFSTLTADVVVRSTKSTDCSANSTYSWAQAMFTGTFFNSGSGDPNDDVDAHITFAHTSLDNPGLLNVGAFLFWQGQYFNFVTVGTVSVGTPTRATLRWVPSGHKFVAGFENLVTHQRFWAEVPYSMSDSTPPSHYWDALYVQTFPANCMAQQTSSQMEANFDNVVISK